MMTMIWSGEIRSEGELVLKTGPQNCPQNCPQLQVKYVTKELVVDKDVEGLVEWKLHGKGGQNTSLMTLVS